MYMAFLKASFDETGSEHDPNINVVGLAGCVHRADYWLHFETIWNEALKEAGIKYFHMNEFAHSVGEFKNGWKDNESKRKEFYGKLWNIIDKLNPIFYGCFVPLGDYNRILTEEQRKGLIDAYFVTYQHCITSVCHLFFHDFGDKINNVATIFDNKKDFKKWVNNFYDYIIKNHDYKGRLPSPIFDDMRIAVPLQAADIIAYEASKEFDRRLFHPERNIRWGFKRLESVIKKSAGKHPVILGAEDSPIVFRSSEWITSIAEQYEDLFEEY
jgi:hypothetical protein